MSIISTIPEKYKVGLKILVEMDGPSFHNLLDTINESPIVFNAENMARSINSYSQNDIKSVLKSASSLLIVRERREVTTSELVQEVCNLYFKDKDKSNDFQYDNLNKRLSDLLNSEKLFLSSKPIDVLSEYENIFIQGRIVSDIRPVFGLDVEEEPKAAMIVHSLRIHYRHNEEEEHKDIHLALSEEDVRDIKKILERAEKKTKTLKALIEKSKMTYLDPTKED